MKALVFCVWQLTEYWQDFGKKKNDWLNTYAIEKKSITFVVRVRILIKLLQFIKGKNVLKLFQ